MKMTLKEKWMKDIKRHTPRFFWTQCDKCTHLFKHEPMWRFPSKYVFDLKFYACFECCPTAEKVYIEFILRG